MKKWNIMKLSTFESSKHIHTNSDRYTHLEGKLLRKYQLELLKMAEDIIDVCEQEGLFYQLGGGSALGAVRHGGFIPWDDDMDINILGDDYEHFKKCFLEKYGDKYWLHDNKTPGYSRPFPRARLKNSIIRDDLDEGLKDECGFYIDVFRLENTPNNKLLRTLHGTLTLGAGFLFSCRSFFEHLQVNRKIEKDNPELKSIFEIKIAIGRLLSPLPVNSYMRFFVWCNALCKNSHSKYVSIPSGRKHYFGELYLREGMVNTVEMPFEGHKWRVARDYDTYFNVLYGPDYMTPPPENEREAHLFLEIKFPEE